MSVPIKLFDENDAFPPSDADAEDLRMAWRDAAIDSRLAYLDWADARSDESRMAYAVYVAAADREAVAAKVLCERTRGDDDVSRDPARASNG
jgi:hypothetical protein